MAWGYRIILHPHIAPTLDVAYLRAWAAQLAVGDLLEAALRGDPPPRLPPDSDEPHQARTDF